MTPIGVDCTFSPDGGVRVRRIEIRGQWHIVEQGRQWLDEQGRHVLVMLPGKGTREILLPHSLVWHMKPTNSQKMIA